MDGMKKYLDVDLVAELSKLVDAHVKHYKGCLLYTSDAADEL